MALMPVCSKCLHLLPLSAFKILFNYDYNYEFFEVIKHNIAES